MSVCRSINCSFPEEQFGISSLSVLASQLSSAFQPALVEFSYVCSAFLISKCPVMVCLLYLHGNTAHFKIALESSLGFAFLTNSSREITVFGPIETQCKSK